jgi:hypothetical protein
MKKVLNKFLLFFFMLPALCSCVNNNYDLDNIDDSGGLSPAVALPIGTIRTNVTDFIKGAGIDENILVETPDTIYIVYEGSMSLSPTFPLFVNGMPDVIYGNDIPVNTIPFAFNGGAGSVNIDVFKDLESNGCVLLPSDPRVHCAIRNYLGADIDINIEGITSYGSGEPEKAVFRNDANSYSINVRSASEPHKYTEKKEIFDKINGRMHNLFSNSPERLSFDFSADLTIPADGNALFIVRDKYIDVDYKVEIPMTFSQGTQLAYADTLEFDLSGDDFINNLDGLTLWIDSQNRLRTTVSLEVLFLDKDKNEISNIKKKFEMNSAPAHNGTNQQDAPPAKNSFEFKFNKNEFDDAKKTYYVVLKSVIKADDNREVNIHPSDYISLKLSAYSKINL